MSSMMMNRRSFLASTLASTTTAAAFAADKKAAPAARPNVVVIVADDLAAWMVGCYGNKDIKTPNIDQMARRGMRFQNAFVCTPICSPSRATLFTGRVPKQHGVHDFLTESPVEAPPQGQKAVPETFGSEVMLGDLLSQAGYDCGFVGKWHMGNDAKPGHGYKYTYTITAARSYQDPDMTLNGAPLKEKGYLTDLLTKHALAFIDKQAPGKPFHLTVSYLNPHTPYTGHPQKYYDMYANAPMDNVGYEQAAPNALREKGMLKDTLGNIRRAAASTTALDDQIPLLLNKLRDRGVVDNTLILFVGDNGYLLGRHGLWSKGLASDPINMYDEVMRVPMILIWPGQIPTESVAPEMVSFYDVMPTLCDALGLTPPAESAPARRTASASRRRS